MRALVVVAMALLAGCSFYPDRTLEAEQTQFLEVKESTTEGGEKQLVVSGLAFNSAMSVERIGLKPYGDSEINILVHLTQSKEGLSGRFLYTVTVPASVDHVTFGAKRTLIWKR